MAAAAAAGAGAGAGAAPDAGALRFQVRELESTLAQLEAERSALKMRSTSAEEQLSLLQGAMAANILRYQKEILRLRGVLAGEARAAAGTAAPVSSPAGRRLSARGGAGSPASGVVAPPMVRRPGGQG